MWHGSDVLREEELELLIGELAQLRTEHIVDANVVRIATTVRWLLVTDFMADITDNVAAVVDSRKIGYGQRRVGVEMIRFYEALKQIPTHLGRLIGAQRQIVEGMWLQ